MPSACERLEHRGARRAERRRVQPQHEQVVAVPRASRRDASADRGPGSSARRDGQVLAVAVARPGLRLQAIELRVEHGPLEFAQPVVARDDVVLVPHAARECGRSCGSSGTTRPARRRWS